MSLISPEVRDDAVDETAGAAGGAAPAGARRTEPAAMTAAPSLR